MKQILIVDDHPMMREGLALRIGRETDLAVCGEAGTAAEALDLLQSLGPDLILLDISLPGRSGLDLIKDILSIRPDVLVLVISMHDESVYAERVLRAGGRGYIMKQEGGKKIMEAIRLVLSGQVYASAAVSARLLDSMAGRPRGAEGSPLASLTGREFEVFRLIGLGRSTREIAETLHLSAKTVEAHRLKIKAKLDLQTVPELVAFAARWSEQ